ncbi:MAG: glycogen debranching enzyme N-terminal domain-containing protein [Polyangiaceae bacterium]
MNSVLSADAWPVVETYGELDATEWLHTNGAGAYAMSTVPMMHTRRYHGVLVAPLVPPLGRFVMLSHAELTLHANGRQYRLSTHQFPGLAPTPGYRLLRRFAMDPIPHWTYRIGDTEFERDLSLARGRNICIMRFTWHGEEPATLYVRPLMPLRSIHDLMHEHGAMVQRVALRQREVEIKPNVDLPALCFRHSGVFVGSPDWWRRFEYLEESHPCRGVSGRHVDPGHLRARASAREDALSRHCRGVVTCRVSEGHRRRNHRRTFAARDRANAPSERQKTLACGRGVPRLCTEL